uniref:Uncharacterized protein n=1 Tax=Chromera velia CCMP2878 TaxID=1169474 RepID=A0A0G4HCK2_9ALVE|eukprot:Cvel_26210.t1-p1 / transcript=Cvel_26210.t1 / gene=Cvel_26210 / organism=Chromera_velia_CCMP2878 / gene_product=hypothetical protein / transcript_product=hypothetical protein / location=Cvel_scaffold3087:52-1522(+) / protein_length=332 / sequence_SO=supercontig / SO=protein_coding / is_pseudo=false
MLMVEERCRRVVSATESKSDTETALLDCFKMAARSGLVRLVRFAVESPVWIWPGCLPSMAVESVLTAAVEGKQLEILRLTEGVCKNRFGLSASIFSRVVLRASAEFGFLEGLEKEFDRGGDGDGGRQVSALKERLCADAAKGGQLETLRVLREKRKCGWGKEVVERASVMGHCQIVRYAALQGCPFLATETLANLAFACAVARSERQESEILGTFRWVFATVAAVRDGERGRARTSSSSSRSPANAIDPRGGLELTQVWATAAHWGADMILHWAAEQPEDVVPPESLFSASVRERAKRGRKKEIADWLLEMSKKRGQRVIERDDERIEHEGE